MRALVDHCGSVIGPSRPSRSCSRSGPRPRDDEQECQDAGATQCSHGRFLPSLGLAGVFWFEIVAGRVKYSGPHSHSDHTVAPKFQTQRARIAPGSRRPAPRSGAGRSSCRSTRARASSAGSTTGRCASTAWRAAPRDIVAGGETATVEARLPAETGVAAEKLPLDIVHQDAAVIVVNKPPGLVVHPGAGNREHTLAECAAGARPEAANACRAPASCTASTRTPAGC